MGAQDSLVDALVEGFHASDLRIPTHRSASEARGTQRLSNAKAHQNSKKIAQLTAVLIDVGMKDACSELDLRTFERILDGEVDVYVEYAPCVRARWLSKRGATQRLSLAQHQTGAGVQPARIYSQAIKEDQIAGESDYH